MLIDDFSQLIRNRHSVRDFRPDPLPDDVLSAILDDARYCPSWSNTRPYMLAVATGEQTQRLRTAYQQAFDAMLPLQRKEPKALLKAAVSRKHRPSGDFKTWGVYPEPLRQRSVEIGAGLYKHVGIARDDRAARDTAFRRGSGFFGAPVAIGVFAHKDLLPFSAHDAGLMIQTLILSAAARGVGSCALGVMATWRHPFDAEFTIPTEYKLITGLALGYESDAPINDFRAAHHPVPLAEAKGEV